MAFWTNRRAPCGGEACDPAEAISPQDREESSARINAAAASMFPAKEPEPDLATKPKDIVGYCFGYVCPKKHISAMSDSITVDGWEKRLVCQTCAGVARLAVVRRFAEGRWIDTQDPYLRGYNGYSTPNWKWVQWLYGSYLWGRCEFVRYLNVPKPRRRKK
jgi:hypothetical protein